MTYAVRLKAYFARFGEHFYDIDILGESEERVAVDGNDESFPRRIEMNGNRDVIRMCGYPTLGKYGATMICLTGNCSSTYGKMVEMGPPMVFSG